MSKKLLISFIVSAVFLGQFSAMAAAKAGGSCTKLGATSTSLGKKYTCIKNGRKLVWNNGVPVIKPVPVVSPTASPTPIPTPTPTSSSKPSISSDPIAPTSFDNLLDRHKGIGPAVWKEAQTLANAGNQTSEFEIQIGPNTTPAPLVSNPLNYLSRISKLWSNYTQPTKTKVFLFNVNDVSWVQQKNRDLGGSFHTPETIAGACTSAENCSSFGGAYKGLGQLFIGVQIKNFDDYSIGFVRGNFGHEYTHTVQYTALSAPANVKLPCWYAEGQPQVPGQTLGFETQANYLKSRTSWTSKSPGILGDYSSDSILKFYAMTGGSGTGTCNADYRPRVYDVGYMTVEALASIKGIQSTMDVVVGVGKGKTFDESFKNVYGISWAEASPILAKVVSAEFMKP
jgi:hypothetical protein